MKKTVQNVFQSWITTIFGVALMGFAAYFFFINVKVLTIENILIGAALGAVGFVFLFVKDELITGLFKKTVDK